MSETLFDAGRRHATSEAARASYDATVASYRETVLGAFQEVEDNLAALRVWRKRRNSRTPRWRNRSAECNCLPIDIYVGGADPYLDVVTAQTVELLNERNAIDILRRRMDASVLLIKGLGGGGDAARLPAIRSMH